jgi:hypothetical protein
MKLIGMLVAALALVPPAKAETPKTAILECEMEWVKDGEQINKRVSVQIDFKTKKLFVSDWNAEGFGIWDMQGGVLKFSVGNGDNEWFGELDRDSGEGRVYGRTVPTRKFHCKETKAVF